MNIRFVLAIFLPALVTFPGESGLAAEPTPILELGPGYVHEDGRLALNDIWQVTVDNPSFAVGIVGEFLGPLSDLNESRPGLEYTWVLQDMVSSGGVRAHNDDGSCGLISIEFRSGRLLVLRDLTPDADFANPSSFVDGEVILEAALVEPTQLAPWDPMALSFSGCRYEPGKKEAYIRLSFLGGSDFSRISSGAQTVFATAYGTHRIGTELPLSALVLDYFAEVTVTVSIWDFVPVRETTWGRIKTLYK